MVRVLVLDDNTDIGRLLARHLGPQHVVTALTDGREAIQRIKDGARFDTIFSDVTMPLMSGVEFYTRISSIDPAQARRIVFLTGGGNSNLPARCIAKPFELTALRAIINEMGLAPT